MYNLKQNIHTHAHTQRSITAVGPEHAATIVCRGAGWCVYAGEPCLMPLRYAFSPRQIHGGFAGGGAAVLLLRPLHDGGGLKRTPGKDCHRHAIIFGYAPRNAGGGNAELRAHLVEQCVRCVGVRWSRHAMLGVCGRFIRKIQSAPVPCAKLIWRQLYNAWSFRSASRQALPAFGRRCRTSLLRCTTTTSLVRCFSTRLSHEQRAARAGCGLDTGLPG